MINKKVKAEITGVNDAAFSISFEDSIEKPKVSVTGFKYTQQGSSHIASPLLRAVAEIIIKEADKLEE